MKKLIALLFLASTAHAITYQSVRASTSNVLTPSLQTGTMNLSSGTIQNFTGSNITISTLTANYISVSTMSVSTATITTLATSTMTVSSSTINFLNISNSINIKAGKTVDNPIYFYDGSTQKWELYSNTSASNADSFNLYNFASAANLVIVSTSSGASFKGTSTNNNATAGYNGEYVESVVSLVSFFSNTTFGDLTSISLTAGDWDVSGIAFFQPNGGTITSWDLGISTTSGNSSVGLIYGSNAESTTPVASSNTSFSIPVYRVSLASTTIYYLKFKSNYSVASPLANGRISARRVR